MHRGKLALIATSLLLCGVRAGFAGSVALYDTGVDGSFAPLAGGSTDPHYNVAYSESAPTSADLTPTGPLVITEPNSGDTFPFDFWIPNTAFSQWISDKPQYTVGTPTDNVGYYTFIQAFDGTGAAGTISVSGQFAVDNVLVTLYLDGVNEGSFGGGNLNGWTDFSITNGAISGGENTLAFEVYNQPQPEPGTADNFGNPAGIQVAFDPGTLNFQTAVPVPLPASAGVGFAILGGFGGLAALRKRIGRSRRIA